MAGHFKRDPLQRMALDWLPIKAGNRLRASVESLSNRHRDWLATVEQSITGQGAVPWLIRQPIGAWLQSTNSLFQNCNDLEADF